jgi:hypothetical protein
MPVALLERVRVASDRRRQSISAYVVQAVEEYIGEAAGAKGAYALFGSGPQTGLVGRHEHNEKLLCALEGLSPLATQSCARPPSALSSRR